jgi:hypothetical protein
MSLPNLTEEEMTLHFYAALVQRDLDIYLKFGSGSGTNWKETFERHLVRIYYAAHFII